MFIKDTKQREKVKCIQVDLISSKELNIISEKDFIVKNISIENDETESDTAEEDFEDKSEADI